jgi:SAM-dependent methyltransferase
MRHSARWLLCVLYHLADPVRALEEVSRVLRSGGLVAVAAPSRHDSPELAHALPDAALAFDAELAPGMVKRVFSEVEVERWDAPLLALPDREDLRASAWLWRISATDRCPGSRNPTAIVASTARASAHLARILPVVRREPPGHQIGCSHAHGLGAWVARSDGFMPASSRVTASAPFAWCIRATRHPSVARVSVPPTRSRPDKGT